MVQMEPTCLYFKYSILPALSLDGILAVDIVEGSFTSKKFARFIDGLLDQMNPFPGPNSIIIMDNCRIHKSEAILDMIQEQWVFTSWILSSKLIQTQWDVLWVSTALFPRFESHRASLLGTQGIHSMEWGRFSYCDVRQRQCWSICFAQQGGLDNHTWRHIGVVSSQWLSVACISFKFQTMYQPHVLMQCSLPIMNCPRGSRICIPPTPMLSWPFIHRRLNDRLANHFLMIFTSFVKVSTAEKASCSSLGTRLEISRSKQAEAWVRTKR